MNNVLAISNLTHNTALEAQALEARQLAILINAIQELTGALGYRGPLRDNDARILIAIKAAAARLHGPETTEAEHHPLVVPGGPTAPEIGTIADILERGMEEALKSVIPSAAAPAPSGKKSTTPKA